MRVQDVMSHQVECCSPTIDLATAAMIMWGADCGVVPVVDDQNRPIGMITDRDICMATAIRHSAPDRISVSDVIDGQLQNGAPFMVRQDDDVRTALETMSRGQVRRLPVVDERGKLVGILSFNDLIEIAEPGGAASKQKLRGAEVLQALKQVGRHRVSSEQEAMAG